MTRLFGYVLGTISGLVFVASTCALIFNVFMRSEEDRPDDFGEVLSISILIVIFSGILFSYVYNTGFGKTKLEKFKEELEILKIKKDIQNLK